ncbi:MAG TPA: hypothetical protein VKB04_05530, partial [Anaerolineales bacterium]|nr:hypothetical protein [Anaerolineales bacterium]
LNHEHNVAGIISLDVISVKDLASKTDSAYLLKTIPDGFSLEVSVLLKQAADEPFSYEAKYTNQAGDYFFIRTLGQPIEDTSKADEIYTTASGVVLHFMDEAGTPTKDGESTSAVMETPQGTTFAINSTLPREQVKALAEELVLVK